MHCVIDYRDIELGERFSPAVREMLHTKRPECYEVPRARDVKVGMSVDRKLIRELREVSLPRDEFVFDALKRRHPEIAALDRPNTKRKAQPHALARVASRAPGPNELRFS